VDVYTIGFTQKTAAEFFGLLRRAGVKRLLDVRLNNSSQLAGFSKREDLPFFLQELCGAEYIHEPLLAPTPELFDAYKKRKGSWSVYEEGFRALLAERQVEQHLDRGLLTGPTVLLCSEPTAERCHRRLALEYLAAAWGDITPVHL
jgi:uncharacterized protein (DUF488 family)